jgi:GWxTD domain-containing protein
VARRILPAILAVLTLAGCGQWQRVGDDRAPTPEQTLASVLDLPTAYRRMGRLASGGTLPFVGTVAFTAGPGDSVKAILGVSLENRALMFQKDAASYVARYHIAMSLAPVGGPPVELGRDEEVRVNNFQETLRSDESILFQQVFHLTPGSYHVTVSIRDRTSTSMTQAEGEFVAPVFGPGSVTAPILAYQVTGRRERSQDLEVVLSPRGTVAFGGDTLLALVEGYDFPRPTTVPVEVVDDQDSVVHRDSLRFEGKIPVEARVIRLAPETQPLGELRLAVGTGAGRRETSALVSFSTQWIITNYDDMLNLLRFFGHDDQLSALRNAPDAERPALWREFYKAVDPVPITPDNEALDQYFARVAIANARFRDEGIPGWRTDRGEVFITLGEPDQVIDASATTQGRTIQWEYIQSRLTIYFWDDTGFGRFRMTPESRSEFDRVLARLRRQAP